jgi:fibronectin type 3 domain-containing protein
VGNYLVREFGMMKIKIRFIVVVVLALLEARPEAWLCFSMPVYAADLTITVNAASPIRTIPMTLYGANLASWDWNMNGGNATFNNLAKASGCKYFRVPGGSWGNGMLWSDIEGPNGSNGWRVSYAEYLYLMGLISQPGEEVHPTLQPIVNFPGWWYDHCQDNSPTDDVCDWAQAHTSAVHAATGWVQDQTSRATCAQYWEIGNEIGGPWEVGYFPQISGTYYGNYLADFALNMKAANPNIKIGAVAEPTNNLNPYGWYQGYWDHDTLLAAKAKNVIPEFFIIHSYQNGGGDGGPSNNSALLGARVNDIAQWTSNMNTIIQNTIGSQYVGQIGYYMTEWNSSGTDTYDRPSCYVNAMFRSQYILEMAKNNWIGSNPWIYDYDGNFAVYPVWYVNPMLINKFGRNMVTTSSSNSTVRAYSSIDANDNLTMFIVNNSPTTDLTAQINITGMTIGSGGQQWLMQPAGNMIPGGLTIQDYNSISINGTVHPDPLTINSLAPQSFTSGGSFTITLPKSCMALLRMPSTGVDTTPPAAPTALTAAPGSGIITLDWNDNAETDLWGYNVYRSTTSGSGYIKQNISPVTGSNYTDYFTVEGKTYYYVVTAVDTSWNESGYSSQVSAAVPNTTPPAAPSGISASAGNGVVSLDWNGNIEPDINGYNVYRSYVSGGPYTMLNSTPLPVSAYNDTNVTNGTLYYYVVTAVDTSLNESANSGQVAARPQLDPIVGIIGSWVSGTTHAKESGNNRALIFVAHTKGTTTSTPNLTAVTYGGRSMTKIIDRNAGSGSSRVYVAAFILNDANITAAAGTTFSPTWTNLPPNVTYESIFLQNVNQTTPLGASASNGLTSVSTISTSALATSNGDMVIESASSSAGGTYTSTAGWIIDVDLGSSSPDAADGHKPATGASETPNVTQASGNHVLIGYVAKIAPNVPPAAPSGLTAGNGIGFILPNWNDNTEPDINGYNIYRSTTSGSNYIKLNSALLISPNYTDTNVINGTTYYYVVTAVDTGGLESVYSSEVSGMTAAPASDTGALLREWWNNVPGSSVDDLLSDVNYPDNPSGRELITTLQGPVNCNDNYGTRILGYLNPLTSGSYTFWIAADNVGFLFLSTDDNPSNLSGIAYTSDPTGYQAWDTYPSQQSPPISLVAGRKYYIEILHKEDTGDDNISVAWEGPGISRQVIDGIYLSPCALQNVDFAGFANQWNRTDCSLGNNWCFGGDFNRDGIVDMEDLMSFAGGWLVGSNPPY